jgi:hypothetical protein
MPVVYFLKFLPHVYDFHMSGDGLQGSGNSSNR